MMTATHVAGDDADDKVCGWLEATDVLNCTNVSAWWKAPKKEEGKKSKGVRSQLNGNVCRDGGEPVPSWHPFFFFIDRPVDHLHTDQWWVIHSDHRSTNQLSKLRFQSSPFWASSDRYTSAKAEVMCRAWQQCIENVFPVTSFLVCSSLILKQKLSQTV